MQRICFPMTHQFMPCLINEERGFFFENHIQPTILCRKVQAIANPANFAGGLKKEDEIRKYVRSCVNSSTHLFFLGKPRL